MNTFAEIIRIIFPIVLVGTISIFVILRLKNKQSKGKLGKKKTQNAQNVLDSLIPWGTFLGIFLGVMIGLFFPISMSYSICISGGVGMLIGYFAYEIFSRPEESSF